MKHFKILTFLIFFFILISGVYSADIYNNKGDFSVEVLDPLSNTLFNDEIYSKLSFVVKSNSFSDEDIKIIVPRQSGWDIQVSENDFVLEGRNEQKEITIEFRANSNFDYSPNVVSPDIVKISKKEDYEGSFEFPILISGEKEDVSLKHNIIIKKRVLDTSFDIRFSEGSVSPMVPIRYTITAEDLEKGDQEVEVVIQMGERIISSFKNSFSNDNNYKIFDAPISSEISPGTYNVRATVRLLGEDGRSAEEWYEIDTILVDTYENLEVKSEEKNTFFGKVIVLNINNLGNVDSKYEDEFRVSFVDQFFLNIKDSTGEIIEYEKVDSNVVVSVEIQRGSQETITYSLNYVPLFILLVIVLIIIVYMYIRISSNPLDVETRIYDIVKVEHEGIKSLKIRIGFENIKEDQIDNLKLIFRMPSYLNVKEDSFLLSPPNHVLKGKSQFKLEWDFKKFEKNDSRIIGFTLINQRGILGDIKMPDLELEVKSGGKTRKYFEAFPFIKG